MAQPINERTTVPLTWIIAVAVALLGTVGTVVVTTVGAYAWMDGRFDGVERRLIVIEAGVGDRWRRTDMRAWVESLKSANAELRVPEIPVPGK